MPGSNDMNTPQRVLILPMLFLRRVMVLNAGRIVEFDSPSNLLEKQGHFYAMAKDAGITRAEMTSL